MGWVGWDLCAGLFYEHRFAMLITIIHCTNMHNVNIKHPERDALWADFQWDPYSTLHSRFSILPEKNNQDIGPNQAECHWTTKWGLNLMGAKKKIWANFWIYSQPA